MATEETKRAPETIGERLRRLRLERGLSQRELSAPGVSYAYISRIEAGARRPSVKALRKLAQKLGVTADFLETGSPLRDVDERELRIADAELQLRLADEPGGVEAELATVLEEALQAGDEPAAQRALIALGLAAAGRGDNASAVQRLENAREGGVSPAVRPDVFATLGRAYSGLGRPARAVALFEECLERLAEDAPDDAATEIRFASYLSAALTDLGDLERAQATLQEVLARAESLDDLYARARLYWSLARLAGLQNRGAEALAYVRRAIALLEVTEDTLHLGQAHLLCAVVMMTQGQNEEAGPHLERAERLFGLHADVGDLASLRTEQAKHAARTGDPDRAIALAREALELLGDDDPREQGAAWWATAEALEQKDDIAGADDAFRKATDLLAAHGHRRDCAEAMREWARMLRAAGRESEALDVLERAAEIAARPPSEVPVDR